VVPRKAPKSTVVLSKLTIFGPNLFDNMRDETVPYLIVGVISLVVLGALVLSIFHQLYQTRPKNKIKCGKRLIKEMYIMFSQYNLFHTLQINK